MDFLEIDIEGMELDAFLRARGYHLFVNFARRHSRGDEFEMGRLVTLRQGRARLDVLAVHRASDRYPRAHRGAIATAFSLLSLRVALALARISQAIRAVTSG